jgi:DNA repair protein RecO (recombination protein O)
MLSLLDERAGVASPASLGWEAALAFRLKLLLAAGLAPRLGACAVCGEGEQLIGFSGAAGGVLCQSCWPSADRSAAFRLEGSAHRFMIEALARPLAKAPAGLDPALGEVERAISVTLEHHAQLRLMPARGRWTHA